MDVATKVEKEPKLKSALGLLNLEGERDEAILYLTKRIEGKTQAVCSFEAESLSSIQIGMESSLAKRKHVFEFWNKEALLRDEKTKVAQGNPPSQYFERVEVMARNEEYWKYQHLAEKTQRKYAANKEHGKALLLRAGCYAQEGKFAEAVADQNKAVEIFSAVTPNSKDSKKWTVIALNERGLAKCCQGDYAGAIEDFTKVLSAEAVRVETRYNTWSHRASNPGDASMTTLKHISVIALNNRGLAYQYMKDPVRASADFAAAKKFEADSSQFQKNYYAMKPGLRVHEDKFALETEIHAIKAMGLKR